jgi:hypothetical protein
MKKTIAIFLKHPECSQNCVDGMTIALSPNYNIKLFNQKDIEHPNFFNDIDVIAFPGGIGDSDKHYRYFTRRTANRIAKILTFGVSKDPTNGYRAVNLSWFMKIVFKENSFPAIMEELYFAIKSGNKIVDFPTALEYKEALRINSSLSLNIGHGNL